ncbi:hypothetical protein PAPHI01_0768 [Pancytospora philotis]|nr:hypothetical protein PAPHI01_0768 [Pancytospora philotis]
MHVTLKNAVYGIANIVFIFLCIRHSICISKDTDAAGRIYPGNSFAYIITSLFINLCLVLFGLLILMNLNDFLLRRLLNLIGAYRKLRIYAFLLFVNLCFYGSINGYCFAQLLPRLSGYQAEMLLWSCCVTLSALLLLTAIYSIHPDLLGARARRDDKIFARTEAPRAQFL